MSERRRCEGAKVQKKAKGRCSGRVGEARKEPPEKERAGNKRRSREGKKEEKTKRQGKEQRGKRKKERREERKRKEQRGDDRVCYVLQGAGCSRAFRAGRGRNRVRNYCETANTQGWDAENRHNSLTSVACSVLVYLQAGLLPTSPIRLAAEDVTNPKRSDRDMHLDQLHQLTSFIASPCITFVVSRHSFLPFVSRYKHWTALSAHTSHDAASPTES